MSWREVSSCRHLDEGRDADCQTQFPRQSRRNTELVFHLCPTRHSLVLLQKGDKLCVSRAAILC